MPDRHDLAGEDQDGMTPQQRAAVNAGKIALASAIDEACGAEGTLTLCCVATAQLFRDLVQSSPGAAVLIEVINQQIAGCGLRLVPTRRH